MILRPLVDDKPYNDFDGLRMFIGSRGWRWVTVRSGIGVLSMDVIIEASGGVLAREHVLNVFPANQARLAPLALRAKDRESEVEGWVG